VLDLSNFSWGLIGSGVREGVSPPYWGRAWEWGGYPPQKMFLVFDLQVVNFGVF